MIYFITKPIKSKIAIIHVNSSKLEFDRSEKEVTITKDGGQTGIFDSPAFVLQTTLYK